MAIGRMSACADHEWKTGARSSSRVRAPAAASSSPGPFITLEGSDRCVVATSVVPGETEVDARVAGVEPARRHHLALGEELHPIRPVRVRVAEERVLPAAERVV